jgi:hypothetical protein
MAEPVTCVWQAPRDESFLHRRLHTSNFLALVGTLALENARAHSFHATLTDILPANQTDRSVTAEVTNASIDLQRLGISSVREFPPGVRQVSPVPVFRNERDPLFVKRPQLPRNLLGELCASNA